MTAADESPGAGAVLVYWRPGCPYCATLRAGLRAARLPVREVNIWQDAAAAARVRAITGGDETVPTVIVGARAMVNPSARQVIATARAGQPATAADAKWRSSRLGRAAGLLSRRAVPPRWAVDQPGPPDAG